MSGEITQADTFDAGQSHSTRNPPSYPLPLYSGGGLGWGLSTRRRPNAIAQTIDVLPTEDAAAHPPTPIGMAALIMGRILRDGEVVILILKPSLWFMILESLPFAMLTALFAVGAALADGRLRYRDRVYFEVAILIVLVRLMWAGLQWMGRLYVLTDQRILRIAGVVNTDIFDCALRKVAAARRTASTRERMVGLGSIVIVPADEQLPLAVWQTIRRPKLVHAQIIAAISRARQ